MRASLDDIFSDFEQIRQRLTRTWPAFGGGPPGAPHFCPPVIEPASDVYETAESVVVLVEIAGVKADEIDISVEGKNLLVRGERADRQRHLTRLYHQMEICCGIFERRVVLPSEVDPQQASATYSDGILAIVLPKEQQHLERRVRIVIG
jgi:HSP20 family protein